MSLRAELLRATAVLHKRHEESPLFAIITGEEEAPSRLRYAAWLRALKVVLEESTRARGRARPNAPAAPWIEDDARSLARLREDLAALDDIPAPPSRAIGPMLELVETLRQWGPDEPLRHVGAQFAIESSLRVGPPLLERLRARREDGAARSFLSLLARDGPARWRSLEARLDDFTPSALTRAQIVDAAVRVYTRALELADALGEHDDDVTRAVIRALNREAGDHATTSDPREVMAAVDAGLRSWAAHPYYEARYGPRGRRFTRSDSAWLVLLADASERARQRQLTWLMGLLVSRGMPSALLEAHLRDLHEELRAAVPERASRYAELTRLADQLRAQRLAALPSFDALAARAPPHETLGEVGVLLVAAVADERHGYARAASRLEAWLRDSGRCSPEWLAAVRALVEEARASPRGGA